MESQTPDKVEAARRELLGTMRSASAWDQCEEQAVNFVAALAESGAQESDIGRELRGIGISRQGIKELLRTAASARPSDPDAQGAETAVCPHCLEPVGQFDHFCPKCAGPVTAFASIDPMGQIYAAGRGYHQAVSKKPRFIVVLGMWLIFAPQIPILLFVLFFVVSDLVAPAHVYHFGHGGSIMSDNGDGGYAISVIRLLIVCGLLALYSTILWKVTARYRRPDDDAKGDMSDIATSE